MMIYVPLEAFLRLRVLGNKCDKGQNHACILYHVHNGSIGSSGEKRTLLS